MIGQIHMKKLILSRKESIFMYMLKAQMSILCLRILNRMEIGIIME